MHSARDYITPKEEDRISQTIQHNQEKFGWNAPLSYKPPVNEEHSNLIKKLKPIDLQALNTHYLRFRHSISNSKEDKGAYMELINNNKLKFVNSNEIVKSFSSRTVSTLKSCFKMLATHTNDSAKNKFYKFMSTHYSKYDSISKEQMEEDIMNEQQSIKKLGRIRIKDIRMHSTNYLSQLMNKNIHNDTTKPCISISPNERLQRRMNYGKWYLSPIQFSKTHTTN